MRRDNDKYQFKEPFGREIRKKMIDSQRKALTGPEKHLKLGQLKPTLLATVGHVANGIIQPEKKATVPAKTDKKAPAKKDKKKTKAQKQKRKKEKKSSGSDVDEPVENKKAKKGDSTAPKSAKKSISDISLADFDNIRKQFPGMPKNDFTILF